jgi:hypothetical protein
MAAVRPAGLDAGRTASADLQNCTGDKELFSKPHRLLNKKYVLDITKASNSSGLIMGTFSEEKISVKPSSD